MKKPSLYQTADKIAFGFLAVVLGGGVLIVVGLLAYCIINAIHDANTYNIWYEYADLNGETGKADACYTGKGHMYCEVYGKPDELLNFKRESKYITVQSYEQKRELK